MEETYSSMMKKLYEIRALIRRWKSLVVSVEVEHTTPLPTRTNGMKIGFDNNIVIEVE